MKLPETLSPLQLIGQEFEEETALGLCQAITKHLEEAEAQKPVNENWYVYSPFFGCLITLTTCSQNISDVDSDC